MTDKTKPISSSNPPESRGDRGPKAETPLTIENTVTGENPDTDKEAVYEPLEVAPSPAKKTRKTKQ